MTFDCEHVWRFMSEATEGPCDWFPPGLYCDECGEPCPEDQIPEPDFEAQAEERWAFRSERWDVV